MDKQEIVEILMRRDGITENEAWSIVEECQDEINDVLSHSSGAYSMYELVTDILAADLCLEPDYMFAFI